MTRFKLAENLKAVKIQLDAINNLNSLNKENDNDDDFTYISDDEDIPIDNNNDNESQISANTRQNTESNEDHSINIFKNRI